MAQPQQRPVVGVVRFHNFLPEGTCFLGEVLAGLARPQKTLPPKYFYDARGCGLFERICELPGYYPARINRELGGDFQLRRFRHRAFYDEDRGWIEMRLESLAAQFVHVGGQRFDFSQGETILTGISCKYSADEFRALAQRAGFAPGQTWTDAAKLFSVHGMIAV